MSVVKVFAIKSVRANQAYVEHGRGEQRREHLAGASDRLSPGSVSDLPVEEFIALGERLAKEHGRANEAYGYILAFSPQELSIDDLDDLQHAGDLAYLLAKKMHPSSPCSVTVHADSAAKHVHAHFSVINHDFETGRSLRDFRTHWQARRANDALMAENDMQVIEPKSKAPMSVATPFDDLLRGKIAAAVADPSANDWDTFVVAAEALGVEVIVTQHQVASDRRRGKRRGETEVGLTFKARDETGPKPRVRRRKASSLGRDFTHAAIIEAVAAKQPTLVRVPVEPTVPGRERFELTSLLTDVLTSGIFAVPGLPGYVRAAAKVGVRVMRSRQRAGLSYAFDGDAQRWHETELPPEFTEAEVAARVEEVAELRALAPKGTDDLPTVRIVEIVEQYIEEIETEASRPRRRRPPLASLPPAAQRHAERQLAERQRAERSLG